MGTSQTSQAHTAWPLAVLLSRLANVVGSAHVLASPDTLERYGRSTAACDTAPLAIVRPATHEEVVALMHVVAEAAMPVTPISSGRNWGYGDACALSPGQLIMDLGRMNRIVHVDQELAYAVIEPGVTQQQLSEYLREHGYRLWMDCTGAGPDTSILGNILERGFGHSSYGNRVQHVAGLRIVLASGEVLHTGFGHYPGARATHLYPAGVGPFLDGMFTQSNVGIVTQAGVWLMPEAPSLQQFICSIDHHADLPAVVDALRALRLDGTLRSIVHIGNDLRVLSGSERFPFDAAHGQGCLPDSVRNEWRMKAGIGAWTVSASLAGSRAQVAASRRAITHALRGLPVRTRFISPGGVRVARRLAGWLGSTALGQRVQRQAAVGDALLDLNRGIPNGRFLSGAYWKRRGGLPSSFPHAANPAQDRCGLHWISPVLPLRGSDVRNLHHLIEPQFRRHGFDLFITYSMVNERSLGAVITIAYDLEDAGEVARASSCYDAVFSAVMQAGYIPYRVGRQSMAALDPHRDVFWATVARIKQALDPAGLIAPGRYEPGRAMPLTPK